MQSITEHRADLGNPGTIGSWALSPDETKVAYVLRVPAPVGQPSEDYISKLQLLDLNTKSDRTIAIASVRGFSGEMGGGVLVT